MNAQPDIPAAPEQVARSSRYAHLPFILRAMSTLKEKDMPIFEKILGEVARWDKDQRERILLALGKVFG